MTSAILTEKLTRTFGTIRAVQDVGFEVKEGEVFGVLGPNGAGKTTLVRLLNGILFPTAGRSWIYGQDPVSEGPAVRRMTGVLTESPSHYERLTARQNLEFYATMAGIDEPELPARVDEMLTLFGLSDRGDDLVGGFSKGMKQRLALARAIIHRPRILFLDEPTAGLDPEAARQVDDLIRELSREEGRTVFLCTHNLHEAEVLCDRVAMLNQGRLLAVGSIRELSGKIRQGMEVDLEFLVPLPATARERILSLEGVAIVGETPGTLTVKVRNRPLVADVVRVIVEEGGAIVRVNPREYNLEELYFAIQKWGVA
jgi:ABC-2 type transport system ATP-binding protein